jgi:hypothetical protein
MAHFKLNEHWMKNIGTPYAIDQSIQGTCDIEKQSLNVN